MTPKELLEEGRFLYKAAQAGKARDVLFWQAWLFKHGATLLEALETITPTREALV